MDEFADCCPVIDHQTSDHFSTGVLIGSRLVLTARHSAPHHCFVRIPAVNIWQGNRIDVAKVCRYPAGANTPDLALLILETPTAVRPASLPAAKAPPALDTGVTLCGFGYTRNAFGDPSDAGIKRHTPVAVPVDPVSLTAGIPLADFEFIAGGQTGNAIHDAESGDSGGPAYGFGTQTVVGIVSRNAPGNKSVFTRVDPFLDWIHGVAAANGITIP